MLTVLLGSALKFEGRFILQTQTDGPVRMLVVDYRTPGSVRACARFDKERVAAAIAGKRDEPGLLLGSGHLAMTIDQGPQTARYQGLVALEGKDLEHAAHEYFLRSEQIPTRVRLAVGEQLRSAAEAPAHRWRAGGMLLQFLPKDPDRARQPDLDPGDAPAGYSPRFASRGRRLGGGPLGGGDRRGRRAASTRTFRRERLLYRLFHARGVRVFRSRALGAECSCSRSGVSAMLRSFPQDDRDHMVENGVITVTCEFCNSTYVFAPDEVREGE